MATRAVPIPRYQVTSDYERFFDSYYNLGTPSCVFEPEPAPSSDRGSQMLPVLRRPRRGGRGPVIDYKAQSLLGDP